MSERGSGLSPLLLVAAALALAAALWIFLREPSSRPLRLLASAPGFTLNDLSGRKISLEELRGRVVFVNFWATWCAPCRTEAPSLARLHQALKPEGFEIVALSIDAVENRQAVESFSAELGLSFPVLLDPEKAVYAAYGATGVPETFMIDPAGRMVERFIGPREWDDPRYARAVRRLLAGASAPEDDS